MESLVAKYHNIKVTEVSATLTRRNRHGFPTFPTAHHPTTWATPGRHLFEISPVPSGFASGACIPTTRHRRVLPGGALIDRYPGLFINWPGKAGILPALPFGRLEACPTWLVNNPGYRHVRPYRKEPRLGRPAHGRWLHVVKAASVDERTDLRPCRKSLRSNRFHRFNRSSRIVLAWVSHQGCLLHSHSFPHILPMALIGKSHATAGFNVIDSNGLRRHHQRIRDSRSPRQRRSDPTCRYDWRNSLKKRTRLNRNYLSEGLFSV